MNKKIIFILLITPKIFCGDEQLASSSEQSIDEPKLNNLKRLVSILKKRQLQSPLHQSLERLDGLLHQHQLNAKDLGTEAVTFFSLLQSPIQQPKGHSLKKAATGTAVVGTLAAIMALINDQKITRSIDNSSNSLAIVALITSIIALVLQAATFIHGKFFNKNEIIADILNKRINNISRLVEAQGNQIGAVALEQANQSLRLGKVIESVSDTFASLSGY